MDEFLGVVITVLMVLAVLGLGAGATRIDAKVRSAVRRRRYRRYFGGL